jgi:hypothetical protein
LLTFGSHKVTVENIAKSCDIFVKMTDIEIHKDDDQLDVAHEEENNDEVRRPSLKSQLAQGTRVHFAPALRHLLFTRSDFGIGRNQGHEAAGERNGR